MAHCQHMYDRGIDNRNKKRLEHDFFYAASVLLLILFALHLFQIPKLFEVVQVKKSKEDAETVPDLKV